MFDFELYIKSLKEEDNLKFRADVTHNQFLALSTKLNQADLENDMVNSKYFVNLRGAKNPPLPEIDKWLKNSWNTEKVLAENKTVIENTGQSFAMQWAFAQAYYTTFGSFLAHFKAVGHTENSHSAVLKKLGKLMGESKLPLSMSFYSTGGRNHIDFVNISKPCGIKNLQIELEKEETINNQICQFLKSTRELRLKEKVSDFKFITSKRKPKKSLNFLDWKKVSDSLGHTTIMDLLYRKRIKANYDDIDTFNYNGFKGLDVLNSLCCITNRLNLVNECYIAKAIGIEQYTSILSNHLKRVKNNIVEERLNTVLAVVSAVS
ncbi:hypothetical protein [uncultured Pontibacter sp.]|uniref:hypothetical protein n=1 Tax=uncultured Pontibacter sp. TaxID=453356 RepID=UPI0026321100|nr:hypothetical protein [uncultured Pontibacter sp.]